MKVLILAGEGLNCEQETAKAFELAGGQSEIMPMRKLLKHSDRLFDYNILAIPGGFSFGDELGSGKILALQFSESMAEEWRQFMAKGNLAIGVCNGFQFLAKLNAFEIPVTLAPNKQKKFLNTWETVQFNPESVCLWTKGLDSFDLPVRHGEGRVMSEVSLLPSHPQVVGTYQKDINGSSQRIAGLCDPTGRILGLMPHPEAATDKKLHPFGQHALGLEIFKNALKEVAK